MIEVPNKNSDRFNFDYRPLKQKVSLREIKNEAFSSRLTAISIFICLTILVTLTLVAVPNTISSTGSVLRGLLILAIIVMAAAIGAGLGVYALKKQIRLREFAKANGMTLLSPGNTKSSDYQGIIFHAGRSRSIDTGFKMPGSQGFEIANYSYVTGSGKHSRTHRWGFIRILLPKHLPHMILDSRSNNLFSHFSNLPTGLDLDQKVSLEGNFDSFFTLYAPTKYQVDARYIFTPDIMHYFIDHLKHFDVEIIDDSLYLYCGKFAFNKPASFKQAVQIIIGLQQELYRQSSRYNDDLASANPHINGIALEGRRLKRKLPLISIVILAAYVIYLIASFIISY